MLRWQHEHDERTSDADRKYQAPVIWNAESSSIIQDQSGFPNRTSDICREELAIDELCQVVTSLLGLAVRAGFAVDDSMAATAFARSVQQRGFHLELLVDEIEKHQKYDGN